MMMVFFISKVLANTPIKDRQGTIIPANEWKSAIENFIKNPVMLNQHNHDEPIGDFTEVTPKRKGLLVKGRISGSRPDVQQLVQEGILKSFSVGFRVNDWDKITYDEDKDAVILRDLDLLEISIVSVPANQESYFNISKGFDNTEEFSGFKEFVKSLKNGAEEKEAEDASETESEETDSNIEKESESSDSDLGEIKMENETKDTVAEDKATEAPAETTPAVNEKTASEKPATVGATDAEKLLEMVKEAVASGNKESIEKALEERHANSDKIREHNESRMDYESQFRTDSQYSAKDMTNAYQLSKALDAMGVDYSGTRIESMVRAPVVGSDLMSTVSAQVYTELRALSPAYEIFNVIDCPTSEHSVQVRDDQAGTRTKVIPHGVDIAPTEAAGSATAAGENVTKSVIFKQAWLATDFAIDRRRMNDSHVDTVAAQREGALRELNVSIERKLMRGDGTLRDASTVSLGQSGANINKAPWRGVADYAVGGGLVANSGDTTNYDLSEGDILTAREKMGLYGMNLTNTIAFLNPIVYSRLLGESDVKTTDKIGNAATIVTGVLNTLYGVQLMPSSFFDDPANAADKITGCVVARDRFAIGLGMDTMFDTEIRPAYPSVHFHVAVSMDFKALTTNDTAAQPLSTTKYQTAFAFRTKS